MKKAVLCLLAGIVVLGLAAPLGAGCWTCSKKDENTKLSVCESTSDTETGHSSCQSAGSCGSDPNQCSGGCIAGGNCSCSNPGPDGTCLDPDVQADYFRIVPNGRLALAFNAISPRFELPQTLRYRCEDRGLSANPEEHSSNLKQNTDQTLVSKS